MKRTNTSFSAKPLPPSPARGLLGYLGLFGLLIGVLAGVYFASPYLFPVESDERPAPRLNPKTPPGPAPAGMVWVPGGEFYMGVEDRIETPDDGAPYDLYADARIVHKVTVDGFWMDATEITNAQFKEFVDATGYVTVAEKPPRPEDFPTVAPEAFVKEPFSAVFRKPEFRVTDVHRAQRENLWMVVGFGANWKAPDGKGPDGKGSSIEGKDKHPVVQICWNDAVAYCKWAGKRLPTEAEWEFAARGGLDRAEYCWGDTLLVDKKWMCNAWQGDFPNENDAADGFAGLAPVAQYPANGYGLFDMAGNAWEWCSDFYLSSAYNRRDVKNPQGPVGSFDVNDPESTKHVQRGGSYLCADNYCRRYIPGARGKGEPSSAGPHIGFRTVKDAK